MDAIQKDYFESICKKINIDLSETQVDQFMDYYKLLVSWNEKINLTSITEFKEVCIKHFVDSLSMINMFSSMEEMTNYFSNKTLIDVGTGAGFPGVCLKIILPDLKITLMDSLDKRIKFLNEVINQLSLDKIDTVHGRVEDCAKMKEYREQFDFATARAVAALPVLCEYTLPFVKVGGSFISYKSEKASEEISLSQNALSVLGGTIGDSYSFSLPETDLSRTLINIIKTKNTPIQYPRKAGTPSKKPL